MPKCKCCGEEISNTQNNWSGVCSCCDLGLCQKPEEYHKLQRRMREMQEEVRDLRISIIKETRNIK
jgi:hypothetical protein